MRIAIFEVSMQQGCWLNAYKEDCVLQPLVSFAAKRLLVLYIPPFGAVRLFVL